VAETRKFQNVLFQELLRIILKCTLEIACDIIELIQLTHNRFQRRVVMNTIKNLLATLVIIRFTQIIVLYRVYYYRHIHNFDSAKMAQLSFN
jgi:hypothetical protein